MKVIVTQLERLAQEVMYKALRFFFAEILLLFSPLVLCQGGKNRTQDFI